MIIAANASSLLPWRRGAARHGWRRRNRIDELTTVGHRRLIRLKAARDHRSGAPPHHRCAPRAYSGGNGSIQAIGQNLAANHFRSRHHGTVPLSNAAGHKMVYTVDGSVPTTNSALYAAPLPCHRTAASRCERELAAQRPVGIVGSRTFAGLLPIGWKVVSVDSEETAGADNAAARAIDGDSSTFWHTRWNAGLKQPHAITVDMGVSHGSAGSPTCRARMERSMARSTNSALKRARTA